MNGIHVYNAHRHKGYCIPCICAGGECCVENIQHIIHTLGLHHNPCTIQQRIINKLNIYNHQNPDSALTKKSC